MEKKLSKKAQASLLAEQKELERARQKEIRESAEFIKIQENKDKHASIIKKETVEDDVLWVTLTEDISEPLSLIIGRTCLRFFNATASVSQKVNFVYLDGATISDFFTAEKNKIERCTEKEWLRFYNEHLLIKVTPKKEKNVD